MTSELSDRRRASAGLRWFPSIFVILLAVGLSGCITSRVSLPRELPVEPAVSSLELIDRINALQSVTQLKSSVGLQFADYRESKSGLGRVYPTADGLLILQRPNNIRLAVNASLIGKIADMGSDGQHFTVAVYYPTDRRSYIRGTNNRKYSVQNPALANQPTKSEDVSSFAKLRPQHFTLPLLLPSIPTQVPDVSSFVIEMRRDEPDLEPAGQSNGRMLESTTKRVLRTYYVLHVTQRLPDGKTIPLHAYWFDRTHRGTPLVRFQVFDADGTIDTEAEYEEFSDSRGRPQQLPRSVKISRPHDNYAVRVVFRNQELNSGPIAAETFTPRNDENLNVMDLDAQQAARAKVLED